MYKLHFYLAGLALVWNFSAAAAADQQPTELARWDLKDLYVDENQWRAAYADLEKNIASMAAPCKGRLGRSADQLEKCLGSYFKLKMTLARISSWSSLQRSADVRSSANNERTQIVDDLGAKFRRANAYLVPEIAKIGRAKVNAFTAKSKSLAPYRQYLREVLDQAEHVLDAEREELLASFSPVLGGHQNIQSLLLSSDIPWPTIALGSGRNVRNEKINLAGYTRLREGADRGEREKVFDAYFGTLARYQSTIGANLATAIKTGTIRAKVRRYRSALEAALDDEKIPLEVYRTLVSEVNRALPAFHRYLRYQAQSLGLKKMEYIDAYVAGGDLDLKFPLADSQRIVLDAIEPLGPDYVKRLGEAFEKNWMDVYPREGKVDGAFMNGSAYEVHPYVLLNHQDNFSSLSTLAHEWGHAMHSVYSAKAQPYPNADYSIFIAEIASTLNEVLLHEKLIATAKSAKEKRFYLEAVLKMIRSTFYRQTQFAEFELALYEEVERGGALTGQKMSEMFGAIARKYYGHDAGVMNVDPRFFSEWAFVPHFYYGFYVYKYATCLAAAFYFAEKILAHEPRAVENYLNVLRAGGSKYPYDILKDAGVDMKDPKVYQAVVRRAERALDELALDELAALK